MHATEKKILLEVYENFSKNHSYEHTIRLNGFDGTILAKYRDAFRNLELQGFLVLHFDNQSAVKDWEPCVEYPGDITRAGIEAAVKERQR